DNAGNAEVASTAVVRYDQVSPTVRATVSPTPNSYGWNNADTTVRFSATDDSPNGAGVDPASITPDQQVTGETTVDGVTVAGQASDNAGNIGTTSAVVKLDQTPPTVSAAPLTAPDGNGWYAGPVTVHTTCADALSGIASCSADQTLTSSGANQA